MSVDEAFGRNVRARRMRDSISQRAFAQLLVEAGMPVDASAVSRIESGERAARLAEAVLISEALGCSLLELLPAENEHESIGQAQTAIDVAINELIKIRESI